MNGPGCCVSTDGRTIMRVLPLPSFLRPLAMLSIGSLALCTAVVFLWIRSYRASDSVDRIVREDSLDGSHVMLRITNIFTTHGIIGWTTLSTGGDGPSASYWAGMFGLGMFREHGWQWTTARPPFEEPAASSFLRRLGFRFETVHDDHRSLAWPPWRGRDPGQPPTRWDERQTEWTVPCWFPVALMLIGPAVWLARMLRRRRLRSLRICPVCGYDLRASTTRCPECGTPAQDEHDIPMTAAT